MIVRSRTYLAGSRDAPCTFQIPDVCTGIGVVPCHLRDDDTGGAQKASDLSVGDGCQACHDVFDRRRKLPSGQYLTEAEWDHYALRALQRTQGRRVTIGLLTVAGFDANAPKVERRVTARKRAVGGKKVAPSRPLESRPTQWPSRKLRSADHSRKERSPS